MARLTRLPSMRRKGITVLENLHQLLRDLGGQSDEPHGGGLVLEGLGCTHPDPCARVSSCEPRT